MINGCFSECFKKGQNGVTEQVLRQLQPLCFASAESFFAGDVLNQKGQSPRSKISRGSIAAGKSSAQIGVSSLQIYSNSM